MEYRRLHPWDITPAKARRLQERLRSQLIFANPSPRVRSVAGADAAYDGGKSYGAVVVFSYPELEILEQSLAVREDSFPYIPGLLSFREGPVLLDCFSALGSEPDLLIFDGQGVAHPREFGLASHLGLLLDRPAIGCAKHRLCGRAGEPGKARGSWTPLLDPEGRPIGCALRTRDNVRPVFISPGHKITLEQCRKIILAACAGFRLPEPLRRAHGAASAAVDGKAKAMEARSAYSPRKRSSNC